MQSQARSPISRIGRLAFCALLALAGPAVGQGSDKYNLKTNRRGVVLIKSYSAGLEEMVGSGFLVSKDGLIFTNRHVIDTPIDGSPAPTIVVGVPSEKDPDQFRFFKAEIVPVTLKSKAYDFAVIKIAGKKGEPAFQPLSLSFDKLDLGADVAVLGYPVVKDDTPSISFSKGSISGTRVRLDNVSFYQTDAAVNPGNSGGPLVNEKGQVVGIVTLKKRGAENIGFALQLAEIKDAIEAAKTKEASVKADLGPVDLAKLPLPKLVGGKKDYWEVGKGTVKELPGVLAIDNDGGPYWLTSKEKLPENFQLTVLGRVEFLKGKQVIYTTQRTILRSLVVRFACDDPALDIMEHTGQRIHWTHAHMLVYKNKDVVDNKEEGNTDDAFLLTVRKQGKALTVSVNGAAVVKLLDDKPLKGGQKFSIGGYLSRLYIRNISIVALDEKTPTITRGFKVVKAEGTLPKRNNVPGTRTTRPNGNPPKTALPNPSGIPVNPVPAAAADATIALPGTADQAAVGGNGRFLIFRIAAKRKLVVFDVVKQQIVKELPTVEESAVFAAGLNHVVILSPTQNKIVRWNLATLEKEDALGWPESLDPGDVDQACMGRASKGPLFVHQKRKKETAAVSLETGKASAVSWKHWGPGGGAHGPTAMIAFPDGAALLGWGGGWAGYEIAAADGDEAKTFRSKFESRLAHNDTALPTADGRLTLTRKAIVNRSLGAVSVDDRYEDSVLIPAMEPGFYMALPPGRAKAGRFGAANFAELEVCAEDQSRLFTITGLTEHRRNSRLPWHQRVFFYPYADLLITLNESRDHLLCRKIEFRRLIRKNPEDYLVVVSRPPTVKRGATLEYQPEVLSNRGGVKAKLISGPKGLSVSPEGKLSWAVPASGAIPSLEVTVEFTDRSNRELTHTFMIGIAE